MNLSSLTMELFLLTIVATIADAEFNPTITFHQIHASGNTREYTEYTCHDSQGEDILISSSCCQEIAQQNLDKVSTCNQLSSPCTLFTNNETQKMECVYDIPKDNAECAEQTRATCLAKGGRATENNVTLTCEGVTLFMQNQIDCLGLRCDEHDVKEYLLAMTDLAQSRLPPNWRNNCQYTEINGEAVAKIRRDNLIASVTGAVFGSLLVGFYLYAKCGRLVRRPPTGAVVRQHPQRPSSRSAAMVELSRSKPATSAVIIPTGELI